MIGDLRAEQESGKNELPPFSAAVVQEWPGCPLRYLSMASHTVSKKATQNVRFTNFMVVAIRIPKPGLQKPVPIARDTAQSLESLHPLVTEGYFMLYCT